MTRWIAQLLCTVFAITFVMVGIMSVYDSFATGNTYYGIVGVMTLLGAFAFTVLAAEFMDND